MESEELHREVNVPMAVVVIGVMVVVVTCVKTGQDVSLSWPLYYSSVLDWRVSGHGAIANRGPGLTPGSSLMT